VVFYAIHFVHAAPVPSSYLGVEVVPTLPDMNRGFWDFGYKSIAALARKLALGQGMP